MEWEWGKGWIVLSHKNRKNYDRDNPVQVERQEERKKSTEAKKSGD